MPRAQTNTDLFGERLPPDPQPLAAPLKRHDRDTFDYRLEHLQYLNSVFPKGLTYMLPPETHFLFQEIKGLFNRSTASSDRPYVVTYFWRARLFGGTAAGQETFGIKLPKWAD